MNGHDFVYLYLAILLASWIVSLSRLQVLDFPARLLSVFLGFTFLNECLAIIFARIYKNNSPVYNVYSLVEIVLLGLFFNHIIDVFQKRNIGVVLIALGTAVWVLNTLLLQPLNTLNTYFLLAEGVVVISLALFSFARMMLRDESSPISHNPNFWFVTILTFFWSTTFFNWGFYEYMNTVHPDKVWIVNTLLLVINSLTYAGYGVVFLLYPSLRRKQ